MEGPFGIPPRKHRAVVNLTPLIDVMFLLLIFFMVSSTFREYMGVEVDLSKGETQTQEQQEGNVITVSSEGEIFFHESRVDRGGLEAALREAVEAEPDAQFLLRVDRNAQFQHYVTVLDVAYKVGGGGLIIQTESL